LHQQFLAHNSFMLVAVAVHQVLVELLNVELAVLAVAVEVAILA
jgi:poly(3-hydroxyalkanoate) synthetase